jgi:glycosyltransferase involved in cell wall biosynthesis
MEPKLVAMLRVRNEAKLIADTLRHLDEHTDGVVIYDDFSEDATVECIERSDARVLSLIRGRRWEEDRASEETRHRQLLMDEAVAHKADWVLCIDADERLDGQVRPLLTEAAGSVDGFRLRLFDAYMTPELRADYTNGELAHLERMFGPEERKILMLWKATSSFGFRGRKQPQREPVFGLRTRVVDAPVCIKHFGKAISVEEWELTCRLYRDHFPEPYSAKWAERIGRAIHTSSDEGRPLVSWEQLMEGGRPGTLRRSEDEGVSANGRMLARRVLLSAERCTTVCSRALSRWRPQPEERE